MDDDRFRTFSQPPTGAPCIISLESIPIKKKLLNRPKWLQIYDLV